MLNTKKITPQLTIELKKTVFILFVTKLLSNSQSFTDVRGQKFCQTMAEFIIHCWQTVPMTHVLSFVALYFPTLVHFFDTGPQNEAILVVFVFSRLDVLGYHKVPRQLHTGSKQVGQSSYVFLPTNWLMKLPIICEKIYTKPVTHTCSATDWKERETSLVTIASKSRFLSINLGQRFWCIKSVFSHLDGWDSGSGGPAPDRVSRTC